jgi:hypothetical protein
VGDDDRDRLDLQMLDLVPELARFVPPAVLEDKTVMSAWHGSLHARLRAGGIDSLICPAPKPRFAFWRQ